MNGTTYRVMDSYRAMRRITQRGGTIDIAPEVPLLLTMSSRIGIDSCALMPFDRVCLLIGDCPGILGLITAFFLERRALTLLELLEFILMTIENYEMQIVIKYTVPNKVINSRCRKINTSVRQEIYGAKDKR